MIFLTKNFIFNSGNKKLAIFAPTYMSITHHNIIVHIVRFSKIQQCTLKIQINKNAKVPFQC